MKKTINIFNVQNILFLIVVCVVFCGCEKLQKAASDQYKKKNQTKISFKKKNHQKKKSQIESLTYNQLVMRPTANPLEKIICGREMLKKARNKTEKSLAKLYISKGLLNLKNLTEAKKTLESIPDDYSSARDENFTLQKKNKQAKVAYQLGDYDTQLKYLNEIINHENNYDQTITFVLSAKMCAAETLVLLGRNKEARKLLKEISEVNDTANGLLRYHIEGANNALTKFNKYSDSIFEQQNYTTKELEKNKAIYNKYGSTFMEHINEIFIEPPKKDYQLIIFSNEVINSLDYIK